MQIFHDMSNLLTIFQISYIYHQVTILAYKILIKKHVLSIHHTGIKTFMIL